MSKLAIPKLRHGSFFPALLEVFTGLLRSLPNDFERFGGTQKKG